MRGIFKRKTTYQQHGLLKVVSHLVIMQSSIEIIGGFTRSFLKRFCVTFKSLVLLIYSQVIRGLPFLLLQHFFLSLLPPCIHFLFISAKLYHLPSSLFLCTFFSVLFTLFSTSFVLDYSLPCLILLCSFLLSTFSSTFVSYLCFSFFSFDANENRKEIN